jgi:hypothetical protein
MTLASSSPGATFRRTRAKEIDGSGAVNFTDLLGVLMGWGPCQECPAEMNEDGVVNSWIC